MTKRTPSALKALSTEHLTCEVLREMGYLPIIVAGWSKVGRHWRRSDLWGCVDVIGLSRQPMSTNWYSPVAIQCTTSNHTSERVAKIGEILAGEPTDLHEFLNRGGRLEVWGWRPQRRKNGDWNVARKVMRLEDWR